METSTVVPKSEVLDLVEIDDNEEFNCRGVINPTSVVDLVKDVQNRGLLQPVVVRPFKAGDNNPRNKKYQLVAGFRRFMAHRVMARTKIEARITECTQAEAAFANVSENVHRSDLNVMQEAQAVKKFLDLGYNELEIVDKLTMSRGWVQIRKMALSLPVEIQNEIAAGMIRQNEIRALFSITDKNEQLATAKKIKEAREKGRPLKEKEFKPNQKPANKVKEHRNRAQIFWMLEHVMDSIGRSTASRALAWAAGEISNEEFFGDLRHACETKGESYQEPPAYGT